MVGMTESILSNRFIGETMKNKDLREKYDEGIAFTFRGNEERRAILKAGRPWEGLRVLEIGCGEGDLAAMMEMEGAKVTGIDYAQTAIQEAVSKYPQIRFEWLEIHDLVPMGEYDRIVMQGVLEHLDEPFNELRWMIEKLLVEEGDIMTSSPGFLNPRGIIWMALHMVGAVMSKTDLHHLHPWDFEKFCKANGYSLTKSNCDYDWGWGERMMVDFRKRIPLAIRDGAFIEDAMEQRENEFLDWLDQAKDWWKILPTEAPLGANIIYHIKT